jgi:hypothetical protein
MVRIVVALAAAFGVAIMIAGCATTHAQVPSRAADEAAIAKFNKRYLQAINDGDIGLDIVNDGELSKGHWLAYLDKRIGGFERRPSQAARSALHSGKDREAFPGYYEEASRLGTLFYSSGLVPTGMPLSPPRSVCTSPITYVGAQHVRRDVANLRAALASARDIEAFLPVAAPASIEPYRDRVGEVAVTGRRGAARDEGIATPLRAARGL